MPTNYNYHNGEKPHPLAHKASAVFALLFLVVLGTVSYHWLENWTWIKSFYFTVCTLTTVGYGDLYPTTDGARLFTALFILTGVGVALAALSVVGSSYIHRQAQQITQDARSLGRKRRNKIR